MIWLIQRHGLTIDHTLKFCERHGQTNTSNKHHTQTHKQTDRHGHLHSTLFVPIPLWGLLGNKNLVHLFINPLWLNLPVPSLAPIYIPFPAFSLVISREIHLRHLIARSRWATRTFRYESEIHSSTHTKWYKSIQTLLKIIPVTSSGRY